jgi:hypothetical protein
MVGDRVELTKDWEEFFLRGAHFRRLRLLRSPRSGVYNSKHDHVGLFRRKKDPF